MQGETDTRSQPGFAKRTALAGLNLLVPLQTGILVAYYALWVLGGRDLWFVDAIGYMLPWLFVPSVLLLPLALLCRTRLRLALTLVPISLFALTYGHLYLPRMPVRASEPSFRAMAYNVLYLNTDLEAVANEIETQAPDLVVLRELVPEAAVYLEERLADRYPFHELDVWCGFWSRFPILAYRSFRPDGGYGQPVQELVLDIGGQRVTVLGVHPRAPTLKGHRPFGIPVGIPTGFRNEGRDADVRDVIERVDQISGPLVVLGDLNLTDQQALYQAMTHRLGDAYREAGWGLGFTYTRFRNVGPPVWRIDYVFHSSDLVAIRAWVGDYGGSDHRPIVADLAFTATEE
jgi:endonuclease/exonuclease/phosphatase (EEP) superfamily protein YafD